MKVIDKRGDSKWLVMVKNESCPYLTYPRNDVFCELVDEYCCFENCPIKE